MNAEQKCRLTQIFDRLRVRSQPEDVCFINTAEEHVKDLIDDIEEFYLG